MMTNEIRTREQHNKIVHEILEKMIMDWTCGNWNSFEQHVITLKNLHHLK